MSLSPPTDPHALFIYNQNRAGEVYAGTLTLLLVATISVALRFLARKLSSATFWWDDWILLTALVCIPHMIHEISY